MSPSGRCLMFGFAIAAAPASCGTASDHGQGGEADAQPAVDGAVSDAPADGAAADATGAVDGADAGVADAHPVDADGGCVLGPHTSLHYASGWSGDSMGAKLGFNLADVSSAADVSALPAGTKALVWLGLCNGADSAFVSTVQPFVGLSNVYGFYLMDEPDPTGQYQPPACPAANLKAESEWIHANAPGTKTFIVMMNLGSDSAPSYDNTYNPANTGIDLYGLDPYPCQAALNGCDDTQLASSVAAAKTWGIPETAIVPVYQSFGGGGYAQWTLPTPSEEQAILEAWASLVPAPPFDYVYAWGSQQNDTALAQSPDLQTVFAAHMQSTCLAGGDP